MSFRLKMKDQHLKFHDLSDKIKHSEYKIKACNEKLRTLSDERMKKLDN